MATLRLKDVNTKLYLRAISEYLCANLQEGEQAIPRLAHGRIKSYVSEEFRKQTDYISIVFIHTESAHAGALVLVSLHLP